MKVDKTYTHFAVQNGKIINGWSYKGIDPEELKEFKKDYFFEDLINMGLNPKSIKIMNKQSLLKNNIDPFNINNWSTPIQENTNKMKKRKINLTELKQVIVNIIKEEINEINPLLNDKIIKRTEELYAKNNGKTENDFNKYYYIAIKEFGYEPKTYIDYMEKYFGPDDNDDDYDFFYESKKTIKEQYSNLYQGLDPKQAIQKATTEYNFAMKRGNEGQADKIAGNLRSYLESMNYNWRQDPYTMDILESKKKIKEDFNDDSELDKGLVEYIIPEWAISALINGDSSGLEDEDIDKLEQFNQNVISSFGNANFMLGDIDGEDNLGFKYRNDIDNLGSNVYRLYIKPN